MNPESWLFSEPHVPTEAMIAQISLGKVIFPKLLANFFGNVRKILQQGMRKAAGQGRLDFTEAVRGNSRVTTGSFAPERGRSSDT
jgi:hypothetical protein